MKALVLCAGLGTRLRPMTFFKPKSMMNINGKPVLEYIVEHLNRHGVHDILVNLHYKPLQIMEHFGTRLSYVYEPKLLGEIGTIAEAKDWTQSEYLVVMNGDTLTNINLFKMFDMSNGKSVKSMDHGVYTGTQILSPRYYTHDQRVNEYSSADTWWLDIGTHKNLSKARKVFRFNEKANSLPKLSKRRRKVGAW